MMDTKITQALESLEPTLVELLNRWIAVPSVKAEAAPGAPFGTEVRRMLDTAMADIRALGFPVKDYDGYACDAEMGQGWATWTWCPPGTAGRRRPLPPCGRATAFMAGAPATTRAR